MKFKLSNAPLKPQLQNPWLFLKVLTKLGCYNLLDSNIAIIHMLLLRVLGINISPAVTYWDNYYIGLSCVDFVSYSSMSSASFKGCGMGPWLVLVSPCFRENVVATCKLGLFLCSLDNLLQKHEIVFFFGNQISKWPSFEKRAIFDLLFTFFSNQGKLQKFLQHTSHSHTYTYFAHPIYFFSLPILNKIRNYQVWFLFGMIPNVDSYSRHFGTINK